MTSEAETRFRAVFSHLDAVTAYARRRGSLDADALAAEVMTIAWRRLEDVPRDAALPWLYATARNLLMQELRKRARAASLRETDSVVPAAELPELDGALRGALLVLSPVEREALLLIAWEDLTPAQAARALGIKSTAFRVRLLRARRRLRRHLEADGAHGVLPQFDVEGS